LRIKNGGRLILIWKSMPGRNYNNGSYKYGFNGKENDNEVVGTGSGTQDYGFRIYNPALGKFLSIDPLTSKFPELTPYQFASDNPIQNIDFDGLEGTPGNLQKNGTYSGAQDGVYIAPGPIIKLPTAVKIISSVEANVGFTQPPYKAGSNVSEFKTQSGQIFVRVFTKGTTSPQGQWIMKPEAIEGLSPSQIQSKFSLPNTPTDMVEVNPPPGTTIRAGPAGPAFNQPGGGIQYQLMQKIPTESFTNPIELIVPEIITPVLEPIIEPIVEPPVVEPVMVEPIIEPMPIEFIIP
jgi:RHS repeat-associated protein